MPLAVAGERVRHRRLSRCVTVFPSRTSDRIRKTRKTAVFKRRRTGDTLAPCAVRMRDPRSRRIVGPEAGCTRRPPMRTRRPSMKDSQQGDVLDVDRRTFLKNGMFAVGTATAVAALSTDWLAAA